MAGDGREAELRIVYKQMDKDKKQKMELLAVSLLNAQMILGKENPVEKEKDKQEPTVHKRVLKEALFPANKLSENSD